MAVTTLPSILGSKASVPDPGRGGVAGFGRVRRAGQSRPFDGRRGSGNTLSLSQGGTLSSFTLLARTVMLPIECRIVFHDLCRFASSLS